jgi:hypothetical protein
MAARLKVCKICKKQFEPMRFAQICCGIPCAIEHANALKAKKEKKEHREAKAKLKSRADYLKEAQAVFNKYIRMRDEAEPCISCSRHHGGQYHAGHFRTVGAAPELRFNEYNCHKQCSVCNNHLSGNLLEYRRKLVAKIGIEKVEWLEGKHEAKKYTIDEIIKIKKHYQQKIKDMQNGGS